MNIRFLILFISLLYIIPSVHAIDYTLDFNTELLDKDYKFVDLTNGITIQIEK